MKMGITADVSDKNKDDSALKRIRFPKVPRELRSNAKRFFWSLPLRIFFVFSEPPW